VTNNRLVTTPTHPDIVGTEALRLVLIEMTGRPMSRSTADRLVRDEQIKPYRKMPGPKGAYLFKRAAVERYVRQQAKAAA